MSDITFTAVQSEALEILERRNAIRIGGHYVYEHGDHGGVYISKAIIAPHGHDFWRLCELLAQQALKQQPHPPTIIASAGDIGTRMLHPVAMSIGQMSGVYPIVVWASKEEVRPFPTHALPGTVHRPRKRLTFNFGLEHYLQGARVLIVLDTITTGNTAKNLTALITSFGGTVDQVATTCNRGHLKQGDFGPDVLLTALTTLSAPTYNPTRELCPLCQKGVPINTDLGRGQEYLAEKARRAAIDKRARDASC